MSGSLQIKNNKYYVVAYIEGKPKWISTGISAVGNNKREAQKRMRDILVELEEKKVKVTRSILFADYMKRWLEDKKNDDIEITTWESYESYVTKIIEPYFRERKVKLQELSPIDIKNFYQSLRNREKPHSIESLKRYRVCLNGAVKMALEERLIAYNPVLQTSLGKAKKGEKRFKGKFYSTDEVHILLKILEGYPIKPAIQLAVYYGLRRSEVLGLRWSSVDFDNNTICIERTVVQRKTLVDKPRTKNKKSYRTLPLVLPIKDMLLSLRDEQETQRALFGDCYVDTDRVCRLKDGTPLKPDYITRQFGIILDRNSDKIKRVRLHDLRHTTASLLLGEGHSLEEIQAYLGHESIISTEIYAHLQAKNKIQTAASMQRVIGE